MLIVVLVVPKPVVIADIPIYFRFLLFLKIEKLVLGEVGYHNLIALVRATAVMPPLLKLLLSFLQRVEVATATHSKAVTR
jgi:hypothetical protein